LIIEGLSELKKMFSLSISDFALSAKEERSGKLIPELVNDSTIL
jgi:hypothetical protein